MCQVSGRLAVLLFLAITPQVRASSMPIDTEVVKKSVVFLYYQRADNRQFEAGTGFLVGIPLKGDPNQMHVVIVTARHVVDPQWAGCPWPNPQVLFARVNTKNYKPEATESGVWQASFNLTVRGQRKWLSPLDERVDVAIIPVEEKALAEIAENDINILSLNDFGTKEEIEQFKVGIGDGIVSAGLVPQLVSVRRNYPAFKFGKISNVFDEPVKIVCESTTPPKDRLAWIVAGNFVPGNSGSPVFLLPIEFTIGPLLKFNGPRTMLLGVMSGSIEGADLGYMVPVEFVFEVIKQHYPDGDLYRGSLQDKPKPTNAPPP